MTVVLAVDQGTSGTKAVVVDHDGTGLALAEAELRPRYGDGGVVEQDPAALLASVLDTGRRAVAAAGRPVDVVALANQGETVLAWDPGTGAALTPAVVWQDRRAESECARLADHAELIAARTGLVLDPYFSAPKMAWLRRNLTTEGVVTTVDSWLLHHLTGAFVTDAATASRSLLLDLDRADWDPELAALFGLADEPLPRIAACDEIVGTTRAFGREIPVAGIVVDQQAALLAEGCLEAGEAKCTYGTGAFLLANTGTEAVRSTSGLTTSVAWRARGRTPYCVDGQVYTAASAIRWLHDLGFIRSASELDTMAAPESDGTLCVPALAGLAAPWWRSDATATFTGMTLSTRPEHLVLAVVQGVAAQVATVSDLVAADLGSPLTRLRADGGLTRSRTLMQAQADLARLPVEVYPSPHATPLGAAALARLALDPGLSLRDAVGDWKPSAVYEPEWSEDRAADFRATWTAVAETSLRTGAPR
ncbi:MULTISPECIES: FGGY family carbohydrate kinase [Streptomyces]|uniref:ATP:glycerol 3-phosphotransferase n=1 Tax=Streptomyces tsukubensis (strain DSM 42081 / NBRC 108919 / NRRL 18488 / 9993) TaxID=1114943 RepID=I2NBA7_STRT9|nr:FGGY family carbohydrate kinase [Streptomyces tsukubensis]MYS66177.1 carbohydrate kinase [Streptomyces sp. SID5473]AZK98041.1 carbohydrate kinase [Streptomyces tsukubensis]EIF94304.1 glycerol kinase [Streptomyces tsukubensis NRRL18488]QKM66037.1 carbohydrate kinase [Streptomyces tsukubensis NRRL18488]TAI42317.1 carbohydrate kinase [Streptomyces tsukubensis]